MDTEGRLARYRDADRWPTEESLAAMLDNQQAAFVAVRNALPGLTRAVRAADRRPAVGASSMSAPAHPGRLALQDEVEPPHFRLAPREAGLSVGRRRGRGALPSVEGAEDDAAAGKAEMMALRPTAEDVVLAVAASGTTAFTRAAQAGAHRRCLTVAMANNPSAPLLTDAEIPVLLHTGPEFLAGSTRMTAGTAQKMALNLFSTQLMIELGRVYPGPDGQRRPGQHQARRAQPPDRAGDHRLRPGPGGLGLGARGPGHQARRPARRRAGRAEADGPAERGARRPAPRAPSRPRIADITPGRDS